MRAFDGLSRLCINPNWPIRKQLITSFLSLAGVSVLLPLAVVLMTTVYIERVAEKGARDGLEEQISRHLSRATLEAAAAIGEKFRRVQYGMLDLTSLALRDALLEVRYVSIHNALLPWTELARVAACRHRLSIQQQTSTFAPSTKNATTAHVATDLRPNG